MDTTTTAALTDAQAMDLRRGDQITVRKFGAKVARKALVMDTPMKVGQWTLVPYALIVGGYWDLVSRTTHSAVLGGQASATIVRVK